MEEVLNTLQDELSVFRYNLRVLRASVGISSQDLSNKLNLNKKRIVNLEYDTKTKPKADELFSIAKYFNVNIGDLLCKKVKLQFD